MPDTQVHAPAPGAALARLLARMAGREAVHGGPAPAERLGGWLEWQRAVALARALDGPPADDTGGAADARVPTVQGATDANADADADADASNVAADCVRVRASLEAAITRDARDWTLPVRPPAGSDGNDVAAGAAAVQRHCLALQRDMQAATGRLRGELREHLLAHGGDMARLGGVDAVMEGLLAPREHALLAPIVPALAARFEALHALHADEGLSAAGDTDTAGEAWRSRFRNEARQVLLAELDLRFQPLEALLAALRSR